MENTLYFKLLTKNAQVYSVKGTDEALNIIMESLFCDDEWVFKFERQPSFDILGFPWSD